MKKARVTNTMSAMLLSDNYKLLNTICNKVFTQKGLLSNSTIIWKISSGLRKAFTFDFLGPHSRAVHVNVTNKCQSNSSKIVLKPLSFCSISSNYVAQDYVIVLYATVAKLHLAPKHDDFYTHPRSRCKNMYCSVCLGINPKGNRLIRVIYRKSVSSRSALLCFCSTDD